MELLIFANPSSLDFLTEVISKEWGEFLKSDARKGHDPDTDKGKNRIGINIKLVSSEKEYNNLNFEKDKKPDFVIIVPELGWKEESEFEGYKISINLIEKKLKDHYFNLKFVSIFERAELFKCTNPQYHNLIKAIPHICLLTETLKGVFFERYTPVHFSLIKSLIISNSGRLNNVEHDLSGIKADFEALPEEADFSNVKNKIQTQLDELSMLQAWTNKEMSIIQKEVSNSKNKFTLRQKISSIQEIIDEIKSFQESGSDTKWIKNKSNYNVLIIEDEIEYRKFFCKIFSDIYNNVHPSPTHAETFNISEAPKIIEKESKNFHVFILDLLYKDKMGNWLIFNGLDLYQLINKYNQYACIRIISSLPRDIISKAIDVVLNIKIPISHIFTKKIGILALKHVIHERMLEIEMECEENEKKKRSLKPFPKEGIFKWPTVPDIILRMLTTEQEIFFERCKLTKELYILYKKEELRIDTVHWDKGQLPSPKMKDKIKDSYILDKLVVILTHRLIVLDNALQNGFNVIDADNYEKDVLNKISKISVFDRGYVQTKLGFNASPFKNNYLNGLKIEFKNLFPHEIEFISNQFKQNENQAPFEIAYNELYRWFTEILLHNQTYQNWGALEIDFTPYDEVSIDKKENIDTRDILLELSLDHLSSFLQSLINNFSNRFVVKIIDIAVNSYSINEKEVKMPKNIAFKINQLFNL